MKISQRRKFPVAHFVLVDDAQSASSAELLEVALKCAKVLAERSTGNAQCFTLIHNGAGIARVAAPHVHIVCARSRVMKGLIYLVIGLTNIFGLKPSARTHLSGVGS